MQLGRLLLVTMVFAVSGLVLAQTPQGTLVGDVRDPHNARIAEARVTATAADAAIARTTRTNSLGEFQFPMLPAGRYRIQVEADGFATYSGAVQVAVGSSPTLSVKLAVASQAQSVSVAGTAPSIAEESIDTTSSALKATVGRTDLEELPLAHRSFANIAYLAPMTAPVEPSDPTKARITAVSFGGSSGLNVDLSVDGGDNNDDYIGGFLQNYSPDAMQEFSVRTTQFDADTSRTNGGSVIISTRRGTDAWHGNLAAYFRASGLNARNTLDNPEPDPKQPYSRYDGVAALGGPIVKQKLWFFSSLEYVHENASIAYSNFSQNQFNSLAQLAGAGLMPGISSIAVPTSAPVPFRDTLFSTRVDWKQSPRSAWFSRGAFDLNQTHNDLLQQGTLPSTGATTTSHYSSFLISNQFQFTPAWIGNFTFQASNFHHVKDLNSHLGLALAFPFSANFHTTSGFDTFGDNQLVTPITAFPVQRDQQKYQYRYEVVHAAGAHTPKFGINFVHEPVLRGLLASNAETLIQYTQDPSFYAANPSQFYFSSDCSAPLPEDGSVSCTATPAGDGTFSQSVKRLGVYGQDSWRVRSNLTLNYGLRYDTTFGLFIASGRDQGQNPAVETIRANGIPLVAGTPHDYRRALAPRLGLAYSPGSSGDTVFRAGVGMYYNDLAQNGWVDAFTAVNTPASGLLGPADQGAIIDPHYHTPYALEFSAAVEHQFSPQWAASIEYAHQQGVHQYRRYEFVGGVTLFNADGTPAPSISVFRTDNRSRYDGASLILRHRVSNRLEFTAHYTLAKATTWGAVVGELFDYVNGVADVRNPFGPGDHGPAGEDIRHRFVLAGTAHLPGKIEVSTLTQVESARPFTLAMPVDANGDGRDDNDRAVVNGVQTSLDQFRGTPFAQVDLRVARVFRLGERFTLRPFAEFFNLFNRMNPGNNYVGDISALGVPGNELSAGNVQHLCANAACTQLTPITSLNQLRVPAGALGDFFGPGTTVGVPFAAQFGVRLSF